MDNNLYLVSSDLFTEALVSVAEEVVNFSLAFYNDARQGIWLFPLMRFALKTVDIDNI